MSILNCVDIFNDSYWYFWYTTLWGNLSLRSATLIEVYYANLIREEEGEKERNRTLATKSANEWL